MQSKSAYHLENITKKFGSQLALNGLDLHIPEGGFLFVTGESGAGKSTLLKMLWGEHDPDSGKILRMKNMGSLNESALQVIKKNVGFIRQDFQLIEDMTVFENVAAPLRINGIANRILTRKVEKLLSIFGLDVKVKAQVKNLSGGEKQRVAICRALVTEPKVVLADEPTSSLDEDWSWKVMDILEKINRSGTTVILASHDQNLLGRLKKPSLYLKSGKSIELGGRWFD